MNVNEDDLKVEDNLKSNREAKEDLEAWFNTEGLHKWIFIPMIYTEAIEPSIDCDECNQYIIEGMKNGFTL